MFWKICCFLTGLCLSHLAIACTKILPPSFDSSSYYSGTENLSGTVLHQYLNQIIRDHTYYSYSPCTWAILEEADQDPTNVNYVVGIYTRRSILKSQRDQGGNTPDYWNREHLWPKSHGFSSKNQHAHTDTHALFASDKSVNADRGNLDFGEANNSHSECAGCSWGNGLWEPPDVVKGDIARAMMYMDVRYNGSDSSGVGDLILLDRTTSVGELALGEKCELVNWHLDDPVSAAEQNRHEVIYSWQGNRNPFIDRPEFALRIWGNDCGIPVPQPPEQEPFDEDIPLPMWAIILLASCLSWLGLHRKV